MFLLLKKAKRVSGEVRKRRGKVKSRLIKKTAPSRPNLVPGIKKTAPSRPNLVPGGKKIHKLAISGKLTTKQLEKHIAKTRKLGYPIKYSKPIGFKNAKTRKKKKK